MAGKLRQGREIDLRRLFQPRLICFPVGVQYADSAETRRLGGFQGVEGILEYQRFSCLLTPTSPVVKTAFR